MFLRLHFVLSIFGAYKAMKKINTSLRAQARRTRALERFSISAERSADKADGPAYTERKTQELNALKSRLGV